MALRHRWITMIVVLVNTAISAPVFSAGSSSNDTVIWKHGELAPPLPDDPAVRAAALAEVQKRATAMAAPRAVRTVTYTTSDVLQARPIVAKPQPDNGGAANDADAARWFDELRARLRLPASATDPATQGLTTGPSAALREAPALDALNTLETFDGIANSGLAPPSPDIAVGPKHIVVATASRFAVIDKCGNTLLNNSFQAYFNLPATRYYYLPRVIYDEWNNRWIMVFIGTESNNSGSAIYVAHSLGADPTGTWTYIYFGTPATPGLKDFPGVSVSPDEVYVTWDRYNLSTFPFEGAVIGEMSKTDFYGGVPALYIKSAMTNPNDGSLALAVRPAQMHTYGGAVYFVDTDYAGDDFITLWKLTGSLSASILTGYDIVAGAYAVPPDVAQPGGSLIDSGDCRIQDAVYSSGLLYAVNDESGAGQPIVVPTRINVNTLTWDHFGLYPLPGNAYAYGAIDVDDNDQMFLPVCTWGSARFPSVDFFVASITNVTEVVGPATLVNGQDSFTAGNQPYRWGYYAGCARDPLDDRTMWIYGPYGSDAPAHSWATRVGAVTAYAPSHLVTTPTTSTYSAGFVHGPFSTSTFTFDLKNTGQTMVNWSLTGIPYWLTAVETEGRIAPGDAQSISLQLAPVVNTLPEGDYSSYVSFNNCTGPGSTSVFFALAVATDGSCPGAELPLYPKSVPPSLSDASAEPGMYLTAIEDVVACAVDVTAELVDIPQYVYARIYEANGNTRGALVAEKFYRLAIPGNVKHSIPMAVELKACKDYEVSVEFTGNVLYDTYNELGLGLPKDVGGVLRLRNASQAGNPASAEAALLQVVTTAPVCNTSAVMDIGGAKSVIPTPATEFGAFVVPHSTERLCSVGLNVGGTTGSRVTARVYASSGLVRDYLIAEGSAVISQTFLNYVDVPISALLVAGNQYDIDVQVDRLAYFQVNSTGSTPYIVDGIFDVLEGEVGGVGPDFVPTLRFGYTDAAPGVPFTMGKPGGPYPPPLVLSPPVTNGVYVTSLIDQQMYSLGVYADVPAGDFVTANVYGATGTTRGSQIAVASAMSNASGFRWHDVPVTASLGAGGQYDFAVSVSTGSSKAWLDTSGLPFNVSGVIQIRNGESNGNASNDKLVYLRMNACNDVATPVVSGPVRTPMLLDAPAPNPAGGPVRFGYSLDEAGPVEITIYDVAGRRAATVYSSDSARPGRAEVTFDASHLASGIYFVKLTTRTKDTARKFVIAH